MNGLSSSIGMKTMKVRKTLFRVLQAFSCLAVGLSAGCQTTELASSRRVPGLEAGQEHRVDIYANRSWQSSGIRVSSGETYLIEARGKWTSRPGCEPTEADGVGYTCLGMFFPVPGRTTTTLIGRIGTDGTPFAVGKSYELSGRGNGELFLSINSRGLFGDNTGVQRVTINREGSKAAADARGKEAALWKWVADSPKIEDIQRYLDAYPGGTFATLAWDRIKHLAAAEAKRQELVLWNRVKESRDPGELEVYVKTYPEGLFVDLARARIRSLETLSARSTPEAEEPDETRLWNTIRDSRQAQDFKDYLARYPAGRFTAKAQARLKVLVKFAAFEGIDFGDYHALVIGNNDYKNLPDLKTAIGDANAVADALRDTYGYKVRLLTDATRADIIEALDQYREELKERDNLLIYYAGHGWLDEDTGRGYWLPTDAKRNRRTNWVSNATITDTLKSLQAKHVMVVADSCYSGTLTRGAGVKLRGANYWKRMAVKRTRVVLTSGGLEPVADSAGGGHSPFAKAFIEALTANNAVMDGTQLFSKIRRRVMVAAEQTPEYSDARSAGHDGGDLLFVRKR